MPVKVPAEITMLVTLDIAFIVFETREEEHIRSPRRKGNYKNPQRNPERGPLSRVSTSNGPMPRMKLIKPNAPKAQSAEPVLAREMTSRTVRI